MLCVDGKSIFNHKAIDFHKCPFHILLICILWSPLLQDICLSVICSLPWFGISGLFKSPKTEIAAVLANPILFSHRGYSLVSKEHFQMQMTLRLGQSSFFQPWLNHHLPLLLFKTGLLSPYASPPVFYLTICFSFTRELANYVLLVLSKSSLMTIPASRGSFYSADVFIK